MQLAVRYSRYLAFAWVPVALGAVLTAEDPAWTGAAAVSAVLVPLMLVVVATILDRQAPHRPATDLGRSIRPMPARSA